MSRAPCGRTGSRGGRHTDEELREAEGAADEAGGEELQPLGADDELDELVLVVLVQAPEDDHADRVAAVQREEEERRRWRTGAAAAARANERSYGDLGVEDRAVRGAGRDGAGAQRGAPKRAELPRRGTGRRRRVVVAQPLAEGGELEAHREERSSSIPFSTAGHTVTNVESISRWPRRASPRRASTRASAAWRTRVLVPRAQLLDDAGGLARARRRGAGAHAEHGRLGEVARRVARRRALRHRRLGKLRGRRRERRRRVGVCASYIVGAARGGLRRPRAVPKPPSRCTEAARPPPRPRRPGARRQRRAAAAAAGLPGGRRRCASAARAQTRNRRRRRRRRQPRRRPSATGRCARRKGRNRRRRRRRRHRRRRHRRRRRRLLARRGGDPPMPPSAPTVPAPSSSPSSCTHCGRSTGSRWRRRPRADADAAKETGEGAARSATAGRRARRQAAAARAVPPRRRSAPRRRCRRRRRLPPTRPRLRRTAAPSVALASQRARRRSFTRCARQTAPAARRRRWRRRWRAACAPKHGVRVVRRELDLALVAPLLHAEPICALDLEGELSSGPGCAVDLIQVYLPTRDLVLLVHCADPAGRGARRPRRLAAVTRPRQGALRRASRRRGAAPPLRHPPRGRAGRPARARDALRRSPAARRRSGDGGDDGAAGGGGVARILLPDRSLAARRQIRRRRPRRRADRAQVRVWCVLRRRAAAVPRVAALGARAHLRGE